MSTTTLKNLILVFFATTMVACEEFGKKSVTETAVIFEENSPILNFQFVNHESQRLLIDSTLTATAEFLAGIPNEALPYARKRHYYQKHLAQTKQFRQKIMEDKMIPMRSWAKKYKISEVVDTTTLFYPYGEGRFLEAYTMFPNCENYILTGTKKAGSIPDLKYTPDSILENYLTRLRENLLISEKSENINNQEFDSEKYFESESNIHQILFHLAQTGRKIIRVSEVMTNNFGEEKIRSKTTKKYPIGLKIEFCGTNPQNIQNLYYFNINLSDSSLKVHPEFEYFLTEKGSKITFLHSKNHQLQLDNFEKIRHLILTQSTKILGDETGVPFAYLQESGFKSKLYGVPSSLKKSVFRDNWRKGINYEETGDLPFELQLENRPVTALIFARLYPESDDEFAPNKNTQTPIHLAEVSMQNMPAPTAVAPTLNKKAQDIDNQKENLIKTNSLNVVAHQKMKQESNSKPLKTSEKSVLKIGTSINHQVRYKVQIGIFLDVPDPTDSQLKDLPQLDFYKSNGTYRYTAGNETNHESCVQILQNVKSRGFSGAFIIAFQDGKRISMKKAQKLTRN